MSFNCIFSLGFLSTLRRGFRNAAKNTDTREGVSRWATRGRAGDKEEGGGKDDVGERREERRRKFVEVKGEVKGREGKGEVDIASKGAKGEEGENGEEVTRVRGVGSCRGGKGRDGEGEHGREERGTGRSKRRKLIWMGGEIKGNRMECREMQGRETN